MPAVGDGSAGLRSADQLVAAVDAAGLLGAAPRDATGGPRLLLMCSAGRDSACLLDVAVRLVGADGLHVLHVDHGLRGIQAGEADAVCVRGWCEALGVGLTERAADASTAPVGRGAVGNLHVWARKERQRLADEVAAGLEVAEGRPPGSLRIATAHTRTDLVETALGRLATQPGRRALLSMRAQEGSIVRPLLAAGVTREETAAYCVARGVIWRDDPSNADPKYARARVRHGVLPVLRSLNPRAEEAITRTLAELAAEGEVLNAIVDAELAGGASGAGGEAGAGGPSAAGGDAGAGGEAGAGGPSIGLARLAELPVPLARLVLRELCERALGRPCPRAASRLNDVLLLASGQSGRAGTGSIDVGDGARIELRAGVVRCRRSDGPAAPG